MATPKPTPMTEAVTPTAVASASTDPSTWRRAAPMVRSIANSRERWATVIDSVLKIVKAPTKIATPPKARRMIRMIFTNIFRPSRSKRSCAAAVWTVFCGNAPRRAASAAAPPGATPGLAATWTES